MPLSWTRNYGKPRVAYTAQGHIDGFPQPRFKNFIRNLVQWVKNFEE
jgi:type 1 glutamine amidotransferase